MLFSLIITTRNRTNEVDRLLDSLEGQSYRKFEVILVDQNNDDRLLPILARHSKSLKIFHVRSAAGASRGRNVGLSNAKGDVVAFPDDDCWYPLDLLERIAGLLAHHPEWDVVSGRPADSRRWSTRPKRISRFNVWTSAIEWGIFLRRTVTETVGFYNESLGPGAETPWGASEGTEYLIRTLDAGFTLRYEPSLQVHHPYPQLEFATHLAKSHRYAMSKGRVLHLAGYPGWFIVYQWARPLVGLALMLLKARQDEVRVRWAVVDGIRRGSGANKPFQSIWTAFRGSKPISEPQDGLDPAEHAA